jgi:hypothetical protein
MIVWDPRRGVLHTDLLRTVGSVAQDEEHVAQGSQKMKLEQRRLLESVKDVLKASSRAANHFQSNSCQ